jgi:hypothetical protein
VRRVCAQLQDGKDIIPDSNGMHDWGANSKRKKWLEIDRRKFPQEDHFL